MSVVWTAVCALLLAVCTPVLAAFGQSLEVVLGAGLAGIILAILSLREPR